MSHPLNEIQIAFELSGTCHQRVRVVHGDYDEESLIAGLTDGTLATTTWHGDGSFSWVEVVETGKQIALIVSQEIEGDYFDYR